MITGAGSGIGRALARELAQRGAAVALCDIDAPGLAETARQLDAVDASVMTSEVDVSDEKAVRNWAVEVRARFGTVHQVYNNAGTAHIGPVTVATYDDLRRVMNTNFWGSVYVLREFLPHLIDSGDGHIVQISSVFGVVAAPWMSGYDASKFAIRGFAEALRAELLAQRHPVRVTVVHPGGVRTPILGNTTASPGEDRAALEKAFGLLTLSTAEGAAKGILRGVRWNRARVLIGVDAKLVDTAQRIGGSSYERAASVLARALPSTNK